MRESVRTHFGPMTISDVEQHIGDFDSVWVKPVDTVVVRGPQGQRPLYTIGCAWECGCETRGVPYDIMRTSRWAPCAAHRHIPWMHGFNECAVPDDQTGGYLVPRAAATMTGGTLLFEAEYGLL